MAYFHIKTKHGNRGRCSFITTSEILSSDRAFHSNNVLDNTVKNWKQPSIIVLSKRCYEKHSWETLMPKCDFSKVVQFYWNHTSAWVFSYIFAAYFQNIFLQEHLWMATSEKSTSKYHFSTNYPCYRKKILIN